LRRLPSPVQTSAPNSFTDISLISANSIRFGHLLLASTSHSLDLVYGNVVLDRNAVPSALPIPSRG
jgi:hypothetical protein